MLASDQCLKKTLRILSFSLMFATIANAGPRETAYRIHQRYAAVPPSSEVLDQMEALVAVGNFEEAARIAMANPGFSNVTLRTFFSTWSNRDLVPDVPLTDTIVTLIGLVRDGRDFRGALYEDVICYANRNLWFTNFTNNNMAPNGTRLVRQPLADRNHFSDLEAKGINLHDPTEVVCGSQSEYTMISFSGQTTVNGVVTDVTRPYARTRIERFLATETAGIQTTRGFGEAFFSAGTNRRIFAFIILNFFGAGVLGMEGIHDTSLPDVYVGMDVTRDPSGDSRGFRNKCVGCHAAGDAIRGAYAYMNFGNSLTKGQQDGSIQDPALRAESQVFNVDNKMNRNSNVFPGGHRVEDDSWVNLMTQGINAPRMQFRQPASGQSVISGNGPKSLGMVLANARLFSESLAKRVFNKICFRNPIPNSPEEASFNSMVDGFEANGYDVRFLFENTTRLCLASLD